MWPSSGGRKTVAGGSLHSFAPWARVTEDFFKTKIAFASIFAL
ncbi:MAG: hypothetical protein ACE5OR_11810 [bacterium]